MERLCLIAATRLTSQTGNFNHIKKLLNQRIEKEGRLDNKNVKRK
jgi:hypothetical protein